MKYDYLIVGAGLSGSVLAERLADFGKNILLVEKRCQLGGNCYDYSNIAGILVQAFGPHIFHTNSREVWDYLSRFTEWIPYRHRVLAKVDDRFVGLPANLDTLEELFTAEHASTIENKLLLTFGEGVKIPILELRKSPDPDFKQLAEIIYEKIYSNYSRKQWGMCPEDLDPSVIGRVPLWLDRDPFYFKDKFQGIPRLGYTKIFKQLLDHPRIKLILNQDYKQIVNKIDFQKMIYTGPIDYFFDFKYGNLPYRSLRFEFETLDQDYFQEVAVVNYPGGEPFTRITEFKHFNGQITPQTTILKEYPENYVPDENIPCYPILNAGNLQVLQNYQRAADQQKNVYFIGRLAQYRYYNMDEAVAAAMKASSQIKAN